VVGGQLGDQAQQLGRFAGAVGQQPLLDQLRGAGRVAVGQVCLGSRSRRLRGQQAAGGGRHREFARMDAGEDKPPREGGRERESERERE
jgi:hypothetical protein